MSALFGFFLRLFICFVAARLLLHALGVESREYLVGLTALLMANVYWLRYLVFRSPRSLNPRAPEAPGENRGAAPAGPEEPEPPGGQG
jgi:hypothetical protein